MDAADIAKILARSGLFNNLIEDNLRAVASLCATRTVGKRDFLFLEGERGEAIYVLFSGSIQLVKTSGEGREVVIKTVEPGEVFAEVILFEQAHYPVSAVALKKSVVCRLLKRDFHGLLQDKAFRNNFTASMIGRLRYLTDRILYLTAYDVEERFFRFLLERYGRKTEYTVAMSKKDIAAAIGTTPETLSRLVLRLKNRGLIRWEGKDISLKRSFWKDSSIG